MIVIVDFGSQTAHLIGRRLRDLGVPYQFTDPDEALEAAGKAAARGVILSGGPASVYAPGAPQLDDELYRFGKPIFGICYGWQLMAQQLGGTVESADKEYGPEQLKLTEKVVPAKPNATEVGPAPTAPSALTSNLPQQFEVYLSHGDTVTTLPDGFDIIGQTKQVKHAWVADLDRQLMGVQFHPEVAHTEYGTQVLAQFVVEWCGEALAERALDPQAVVKSIRQQVEHEQVLCAVSGGVDSTVVAALIGTAIGDQLIPVYVESGLMRPGTRERVEEIFTDQIPASLVVIEAEQQFMEALAGVTDPEEKRKTIGQLYVELFEAEAAKHAAAFLGQGTIYSDVIESKGSKRASQIKSHHNVGGLPQEMQLQLLEPVRDFYKDEVRELGRMIGLPEAVVMQQPFPGPGYAIRIRGEVTSHRLRQCKLADQIVMEEIKAAGLWETVFQCFPVMTGAQSTAVKGDARVFAEVVAVRAYESEDVMTSRWAHLPYEVLQTISSRIVNEVPDVSRVVYDITTKPPATMEWE